MIQIPFLSSISGGKEISNVESQVFISDFTSRSHSYDYFGTKKSKVGRFPPETLYYYPIVCHRQNHSFQVCSLPTDYDYVNLQELF